MQEGSSPDLVAPGGHISGIVDPVALYPSQYALYSEQHHYTS
jgi:hypothetical protein